MRLESPNRRRGFLRESLPHAQHRIDRVSDALVKIDHLLVGVAHLQINLPTTSLAQQSLGLDNQLPRIPSPLMHWINPHQIQPPPMPIVSRHDAGHDLLLDQPNQKQPIILFHLVLNIQIRIIPRPHQIAAPPQLDDRGLVLRMKLANLHRANYADFFKDWRELPWPRAAPIPVPRPPCSPRPRYRWLRRQKKVFCRSAWPTHFAPASSRL